MPTRRLTMCAKPWTGRKWNCRRRPRSRSSSEVNTALFPILTAVLSGPVPERTLVGLGNDLQDRLEAIPGVLEVDIGGEREAMLEVLVDPTMLIPMASRSRRC